VKRAATRDRLWGSFRAYWVGSMQAKKNHMPLSEPGDYSAAAGETSPDALLIRDSVVATLIRLAAPMLVGVFSMTAFNLTDAYFVSLLGTKALAAMGFTFPVVLVLNAVSHGIALGAAAIISQVVGAGDKGRMRRLATDASILALLIAIPLTLLGLLTVRPLFAALGAGPDLLPVIRRYMVVWYIGLVFVMVPAVGMNALRALGDAVTPAVIMLVAFGMNVILDPLLIFGLGVVPGMGIAGAAWATVISRGLTALAVLWVMGSGKGMFLLSMPDRIAMLQSWRDILHVGAPAAGTLLLAPLSQTLFIRIVAVMGPEAVAAVGAGMRLEGFAFIVVMALSSALLPFVGQNWGAGRPERVDTGVRRSVQFALAWGVLCLLLLVLFAGHLARLFSRDPAVIAHLRLFLWIVPLGYGLQGVVLLAGSTFNAVRRPGRAVALSVVHLFGLLLPLAYIGLIVFGFIGVLAGAALANASAGTLALVWLHGVSGKQKPKQG